MKYQDLRFEMVQAWTILWSNGRENTTDPALADHANAIGVDVVSYARCPLCGRLIEAGPFTQKGHLEVAHGWRRLNLTGDGPRARAAADIANALGGYEVVAPA